MAVAAIRKSFSRKAHKNAAAKNQSDARPDSLTCVVNFLDASQASFSIEKRSRPSDLLDDVCSLLSLQEKDYFGFTYMDETGFQCWLHDYKSIHKQMPGDPPYSLKFAVKFYVPDPTQLREDVTRYQFCLQVRSDLYLGRLRVDPDTLAEIAALSLQAELGDHDESILPDGYERQYEFVPNQEELNICDKVVELHKQQDGLLPFEAELRILNIARNAEGYGKQTFDSTDPDGVSVQLAACHRGLVVKPEGSDAQIYTWPEILKMSYKKKRFVVKVSPAEGAAQFLSFAFNQRRAAKEVWKIMQEQHDFFRLEFAFQPSKFQFLRLGSKFRYSGRTQYQIKRMEDFSIRPGLAINRAGSVRRSGGRVPLPARSPSSASNHRTDVTLTVIPHSNSLPGRTYASTEGPPIHVNIEDVMRHRLANGSQGGSSRDMSINEEKASMLVHVSTPAASQHNLNSNIPMYSTANVPGGEDDLEPDYQELNGPDNAKRLQKTSASQSADALTVSSDKKSQSEIEDAKSEVSTAGSGSSDRGTASVVKGLIAGSTSLTVNTYDFNKRFGEPKRESIGSPEYEEIPDRTLAPQVRVRSGTYSHPRSHHCTPHTSSSSLPMFNIRKSASAMELGRSQTAQPGFQMHRAGSSMSARSVISTDVQELMDELGIADPIEEEDDPTHSSRNSHTKTDEDDDGGGDADDDKDDDDDGEDAPENFEENPFAQPGMSQYAVGAFGVTPVTAATSS